MSEDKAEAKSKVSWSSIFATIAAGLLLAAFTYGFSSLITYVLTEKVEIYFVERPRLDGGRFQKIVVIDNFSSSTVEEIQFSIVAENGTVSSQINVEKLEQSAVGPRTMLVKVFGLLPNRQASFVLQSDVAVPEETVRLVKGPTGVAFKAKDKLHDSWFDWPQFLNALIQFLIYVVGMTYFERSFSQIASQSDELNTKLKKTQTEMENTRALTAKLRQDELRNKLLQVRRILNLTREVRLWREISVGILQQDGRNPGAAKRLLAVILRKAGITPTKTFDELDEEELLEAIENAKSRLSVLS